MKTDKISKTKCSENIEGIKICLDFNGKNSEKCNAFKRAWINCL